MTYTLIPSAAYINMELAAEYGRIPPAFLPVGHSRLYELQIESLQNGDLIFLTLPQSYIVPAFDMAFFSRKGVQIIPIPDGLTLGRSIQYALDLIGKPSDSIRILHGDTLIPDAPLDQMDVVAVGVPPEGYEWGQFAPTKESDSNVLAGYFVLSNPIEFRRSLTLADGSFTLALSFYSKQIELKDIVVNTWLDFGHLQTFYRARCNIHTQRAFNELHLDFQRIRKTAENHKKIDAESSWFRLLPDSLRLYTPAYLGSGVYENGQPWYELEYLPLPSLHELFVFGELSSNSWKKIFQGCVQFIENCREQGQHVKNSRTIHPGGFREAIHCKTTRRLNSWLSSKGLSQDNVWSYRGQKLPSLRQIVASTAQAIGEDSSQFRSVMHGDFCFTNIFFDFRTMRIRTIDPRGGMDDDENSILGDWRYDLAKISHSLIGGYDLVLAGRYRLLETSPFDVTLDFIDAKVLYCAQEQYGAIQVDGMNPKSIQIISIVIHLFLSMIPLHADRPDRQNAFFANALRLYYEYFFDKS